MPGDDDNIVGGSPQQPIDTPTVSMTGRTFQITLPDDDAPLKIILFGCHGTKNTANQHRLAKMIMDVRKKNNSASTPTSNEVVVILGDNFYKHGVSSDRDLRFFREFYEPFRNLLASSVRFFAIPGNHDEDVYRGGLSRILGSKHMSEKIQRQIKHTNLIITYKTLKDETPILIEKILGGKVRDKITENDVPVKVELEDFDMWNMWARYYSTQFIRKNAPVDGNGNQEVDTEIFYVDSNILAKDALTYLKNPESSELNSTNNQYVWLQKALNDSKAKNKIIAQHHPLETYSKRAIKSDTKDYLTHTEEAELKEKLEIKEANHAELLRAVYKKMGVGKDIHIQLVASAHDHHQAVTSAKLTEDYSIPQLIAGGGGGRLQDHTKATDGSLHYLDKAHGFTQLEITTDGKKQLHCYTLMKNEEIREIIFDYKEEAGKPIWNLTRMAFKEPAWANQFIDSVAAGIKSYQEYLEKQLVENFKKDKKIEQADELRNLLNQQYENNFAGFKMMVHNIHNALKKSDKELVKRVDSNSGSIEAAYRASQANNYVVTIPDDLKNKNFENTLQIQEKILEVIKKSNYDATFTIDYSDDLKEFTASINLKNKNQEKEYAIPGKIRFCYEKISGTDIQNYKIISISTSNRILQSMFQPPLISDNNSSAASQIEIANNEDIFLEKIIYSASLQQHYCLDFAAAFAKLDAALKEIEEYAAISDNRENKKSTAVLTTTGLVENLNETCTVALSSPNNIAWIAATTFVVEIRTAKNHFLEAVNNQDNPHLKDAYNIWQTACNEAIKKAKPVLGTHRDWKGKLANVIVAITGVGGVLMLAKGLITLTSTGYADFLFFSTTSKNKLAKVEKAIETAKPSQWIAPVA
jgi:hypothetical protein